MTTPLMMPPQGYLFYPSRYAPPLGRSQLDILLLPIPAARVFDVHVARFPALVHGETVWLTASWGEMKSQIYRAAPGRFWLQDGTGDIFEGYSFGGRLEIAVETDSILCRLTSSAPLFEIEPEAYEIVRLFVDEVEAAVAIERARWRSEDEEWPPILAPLDPMTLFTSCLATVSARLEPDPHDRLVSEWNTSLQDRETLAWVHRAIRILQKAGEWPEQVMLLDQLSRTTAALSGVIPPD